MPPNTEQDRNKCHQLGLHFSSLPQRKRPKCRYRVLSKVKATTKLWDHSREWPGRQLAVFCFSSVKMSNRKNRPIGNRMLHSAKETRSKYRYAQFYNNNKTSFCFSFLFFANII